MQSQWEFLLCICVCGKLFPKMAAATSFILYAFLPPVSQGVRFISSAVSWIQDFVLQVECKRNDILGFQGEVLGELYSAI